MRTVRVTSASMLIARPSDSPPVFCDKRVGSRIVPLSADEHGKRAVGHHFGRLTAHKKLGHAATAVRSHDNQIASPRFGGLYDPFGWILFPCVYGLAGHTHCPRSVADR